MIHLRHIYLHDIIHICSFIAGHVHTLDDAWVLVIHLFHETGGEYTYEHSILHLTEVIVHHLIAIA